MKAYISPIYSPPEAKLTSLSSARDLSSIRRYEHRDEKMKKKRRDIEKRYMWSEPTRKLSLLAKKPRIKETA